MNVDDDPEDIKWIRGLGGERLPAASYTLLPNLKKKSYYFPLVKDDNSCLLFSTHP